jgi:tripartite-type tricarboxylate transporter receptor subunit TctC
MKLPRRKFLHLAAGAAALPVVSCFAWAQAYPNRPVRIVVPFAAGGTADILGRLLAQWLSERLGQQFFVDDRPGAATNTGTQAVVRAPADGYTLLLITPPNVVNVTLYENLNFNFVLDVAPVASVSTTPGVVAVNPRFRPRPFRSSSPMPRPTRARSRWQRKVMVAQRMSTASCSSRWRG